MEFSNSRRANNRLCRSRAALAITTALVSMNGGSALAQSVTTSTTVADLNTAINTATTAPTATVNVTATGVVTGPGAIAIGNFAAGRGDGDVTFTNQGNVGSVSGSTVTNSVGVVLSGAGETVTANTATVNNSGLITRGIAAQDFGSGVEITNSGIVYGNIVGSGYGSVSITTTAAGSLIGGISGDAITAQAFHTATRTTENGVQTLVRQSGDASIVHLADAKHANDTRAGLHAESHSGNATIEVNGTTGYVWAGASMMEATNWSGGLPAVNGETTVVQSFGHVYGSGTAEITIGADGDVSGVSATGVGGATVAVDGKVGNGGVQASAWAYDYSGSSEHALDDDGNTVRRYDLTKSTATDGVAAVDLRSTSLVMNDISAGGSGGAVINVDGDVRGRVFVRSQAADGFAETTSEYAGGHVVQVTELRTRTLVGGEARVTVGTGGVVSRFIQIRGDAGSTVVVDGSVGGDLSGASDGINTTAESIEIYDEGGLVSSIESRSETLGGGFVSVTVGADGTVGGYVTAVGDAGASVVANGNTVGGIRVIQTRQTDKASTKTYTGSTNTTVTQSSSTYRAGSVTLAVGTGVTVGGRMMAQGTTDVSVTTAASSVVKGWINVDASPGNSTTTTTTILGPDPITGDASNSTEFTEASAGGNASFRNTGYVTGNVEVVGVTGATVTNTGQVVGTTNVTTAGSRRTGSLNESQVTAIEGDVTTVTHTEMRSLEAAGIAGDITGNYSGTNGRSIFEGFGTGGITQTASGNSTANVSGTAHGEVNSDAGVGLASSVDTVTVTSVSAAMP